MLKLPLHFEVNAETKKGILTSWQCTAGSHTPISCSVPPEFQGSGEGYSPEDFFGFAILNCIIATFKVYCEKGNLHFDILSGKAKVVMGKDPSEKCLCITDVDITIDIKGASDVERVKKTLDQAIKDCAISNSIKSGKTFHLTVN